jgi:hypothetical protein
LNVQRPVSIAAIGLLCPAGIGAEAASGGRPGPVPDFQARAYVPNRKNLKLMSRAVQLGVSAIRLALGQVEGWESVPAARRGMFVGATPLGGEAEDLIPALQVATGPDGHLDLARFAAEGIPLIHPLWLVKGLSNNVLGFASAEHDFQGTNGNWCDGPASGAIALAEGWAAVAEGRAELVVAGAADAWVELQPILGGRNGGEGAAFFVLRPAAEGDAWIIGPGEAPRAPEEEQELGFIGAAAELVAVARALLRGEAVGLTAGGLRLSPAFVSTQDSHARNLQP